MLSKKLWLLRDTSLEVAKNLAMGVAAIRGLRLAHPRTSAGLAHDSQALERYVFALLREVLTHRGGVEGLRVAEIGPGDHIATGLAMLAAGAASYTSLDRFPGLYGNDFALGWYRAVKRAWPSLFPERSWPAWLDVERFPGGYPDKVRSIPVGVENFGEASACWDVVCSYAVGEHVSDLDAFAGVTAKMLTAAGVAIHVVDFSQHQDWGRYNDPFLFLRFPDWLWKLMGSNRGLPNRFRFHELVAAFEAAGLRVECTQRAIAPELARPASLAARFRGMPLDSIKTLQATLVCSKASRP